MVNKVETKRKSGKRGQAPKGSAKRPPPGKRTPAVDKRTRATIVGPDGKTYDLEAENDRSRSILESYDTQEQRSRIRSPLLWATLDADKTARESHDAVDVALADLLEAVRLVDLRRRRGKATESDTKAMQAAAVLVRPVLETMTRDERISGRHRPAPETSVTARRFIAHAQATFEACFDGKAMSVFLANAVARSMVGAASSSGLVVEKSVPSDAVDVLSKALEKKPRRGFDADALARATLRACGFPDNDVQNIVSHARDRQSRRQNLSASR